MRKIWLLLLLIVIGGSIGGTALWVNQRDRTPRSGQGVVLALNENLKLAMERLTIDEITQNLAEYEQKLTVPAIEPTIDPINKGLIPGIAGRMLDLSATAEEVLAAAAHQEVAPVYRALLPKSAYQFPGYPIYHGNSAKKEIALVINVAWGNENIPSMLETLEKEDVKASFFLVGRWAAQNEDMIRTIAAGGHEFGNHAYSDPHLPQLSREAIAQEIIRTSEVIQRVTGEKERFFSPPYNDFNQTVLDVASELGYLTVLCSLDTADWMRPGVERMINRIVPKAHNGAIVLMHPTEQTPDALKGIISGLKEKGYSLVTVGELLSPIPGSNEIPHE